VLDFAPNGDGVSEVDECLPQTNGLGLLSHPSCSALNKSVAKGMVSLHHLCGDRCRTFPSPRRPETTRQRTMLMERTTVFFGSPRGDDCVDERRISRHHRFAKRGFEARIGLSLFEFDHIEDVFRGPFSMFQYISPRSQSGSSFSPT